MAEVNATRVVQAFVGEYASGKSENAVNAALHLKSQGHQVCLVDLDLVEPCYTLRPIKEELTNLGLDVLAWETKDTFGLGEAGQTVLPSTRWVFWRSGDIIIDVGYGVYGSRSLNLLESGIREAELQVVLVLNTCRPMTGNQELIEEYISEIGRVDAVIANSNLVEETVPETVQKGYELISTVCDKLNLPLLYISVSEEFVEKYPDFSIQNQQGETVEIRVLKRFMPRSFW